MATGPQGLGLLALKETFSIFLRLLNKSIFKQQHTRERCEKLQKRRFKASKIAKYPSPPIMVGAKMTKLIDFI